VDSAIHTSLLRAALGRAIAVVHARRGDAILYARAVLATAAIAVRITFARCTLSAARAAPAHALLELTMVGFGAGPAARRWLACASGHTCRIDARVVDAIEIEVARIADVAVTAKSAAAHEVRITVRAL
jgi:hypothetical protein